MLTETGQVVSLDGEFALVDVARTNGCQSCSVKSGCGTSVLSGFFAKKFSHVKALNQLNAVRGDTVEIALDESALVFMTFWTYLFPIICLFAIAFLAAVMGFNAVIVSVGSIAGLIAGIFWSRSIIQQKLDKQQLHPVVCKVVKS